MTPDRFFLLMLALQARQTTTTADLAANVGVSVRTVLRDLQWLQEAGFPLLARRGRGGGVTLLPGGMLDTARLTPDERDHLAIGGLDDSQREQLGSSAVTQRALRKLQQSESGTLPLSAVVTTDNRPWFSREWEGLPPAALVGDVRRGVRLRIHYRRAEESEPTWRVVDPYGLLAKAGKWYLVADCAKRPRLHALERLCDWEPIRAPRRLRAGVSLTNLAQELTAQWENPSALTIQAELDARYLARARRILGARMTIQGDSAASRVAIALAARHVEDVRMLLQFGDAVTVTGPPEARDRIRELAAQIVEQYAS